ncbi:MAG: endonuclease/exonuclease/phosphatase family protein, partial [Clostridia bacterium]|nr:endonuclease/exonuclease/phosphatase family protein [Clostridia bacterium]
FFPLSAGTKYTVYFTLTMDAGMKCAFYPDGKQGIDIIQNSTYTKYQSWSTMSGTEANWANKTDCGSSLKKFAVEIDYDTGTLTLYGRNINGLYSYINQATGLTFDSDVLYCAFWAGNTAGSSVTVSNVSIEKGLTVEELDKAAIGYTAFQALSDNTLLKTMDFNENGWNPGFASDSNKGADVVISNDGSSVEFTIHNGDNYRAMWGAPITDTFPLYDDVQYTFVYDVTFGNENVSVALFPDADNGLVIYGNGTVQWYRWNSQRGGLSEKWNNYTDVEGLTQTFAVAMDYKTEYLYLYVKQANGSFKYVTRQTCSDPWDAVPTLYCQFRVAGGNKSNPPDGTYTATVSNFKVYKGLHLTDRYVMETAAGAAVRLDNPTGLRFTGYIGKDLLDGLRATYGNGNVKIGMFITPTDYLTDNSLDFTKEALDGCGALPAGKKYRKIEATTVLESEDGNAYKINCVLANVLEENYGRKFSAVTYIEINGSTYLYADYTEADNARSIAFVAEAALLDVSDTQTGEYQYEVTETGKYSPYTEAQRNTLEGFRSANSFTIMSYNIEMYDEDTGWEERDPEKVIETILDNDPDIVGLQEVNQIVKKNWLGQTTMNEGWDDYMDTLTSHGYSLVKGDTDSTCWNNLLYKTSKFNKLNSGCEIYRGQLDEEYDGIVDPNGADNSRDKMYRMFTWARLQDKETGKIVLAISAHLHYRKNTDDTASNDENTLVRQYEVRLMLAWIAEQTFDYDGVVIVGDMNAHYLEAEDGRGRRVIDVFRNEGGYSIARDSAAIKGDTAGTLATTGRTTRPEWIYDYILTKGDLSTLSFTVVDNKIDNDGSSYPSDHVPVKATIVFD